jgi:hypothetical protein
MRTPALTVMFAVLLSSAAFAQATWQPASPPLVTAENTTWYQTGEPIIWNGDYYYPAGAVQGFNPYQMVRAGSYLGIPLYTDATLEPYSIVFVPLNGARLQPYERRRTGQLAGTTGSRAPSLPTDIGAEGTAPATWQAQGPPAFARAYDVARMEEAELAALPRVPIATAGRDDTTESRPVTTVLPPTGANAIWIEYDGERWYASGRSIAYDASRLSRIGSYYGWAVYTLKGDANTIYVPTIPGRLAPYSRR